MKKSPSHLTAAAEAFLAEPHLATLTTFRPDGSPHVAPVRFTWDGHARLARVMSVGSRRKATNVEAHPDRQIALCQVVGFRWITLEGTAMVFNDRSRIAEGTRRYAQRYSSSPPTPSGLVVIEIAVDRVMELNN
ncbi:pyridoxamine 5'-phosphate oxidase family protein [Phytoactinopolyspora endophytica]|uniref:pyridoxamine 5'-phosphate oxidase family protein n=1 Tax=Phytoactinopolyspora endophytica TaxID=1642495 RepID=UPI00101C77EC|nr:pyridoxamine 5'-phosphate oxidase family protein [Phytoactinopolyspora endophytica]